MYDYWRDHPHPLTIVERKEKNRVAAVQRLERMRARKGPVIVRSRPWGRGLWMLSTSHDSRQYGPFAKEARHRVEQMMLAGTWNPENEAFFMASDEPAQVQGRLALAEREAERARAA
ncbi:MAG: hypothetical protein RIB84_01045 [Sneathiellaceae bacterium]